LEKNARNVQVSGNLDIEKFILMARHSLKEVEEAKHDATSTHVISGYEQERLKQEAGVWKKRFEEEKSVKDQIYERTL
jgi:hypothetical protein